MLLRPHLCARATSTLLSRPLAMPLRAKILNSAIAQQKMAFTAAPAPIREQPGDDPEDVLFNANFGVRTIELNRPAKLNALNGSMARKLVPRLQEWEKSQLANIIILKGAGPKALCAGGDVEFLASHIALSPSEGIRAAIDFFALEYQLDHLIATYGKPYVAFMDGVTMGGGVGLSVHAPFRVATERTRFAMPETKIGFFPDVGGSFFLPRMEGMVGTYLALTGVVVNGVQTMYAGLATHYIHSSSLPDLEQRLSELKFDDYASAREKLTIVDSTIEEFVTGLPEEPIQLGGEVREAIDRCFRFNTLEEIISALEAESTPWATETLQTLHARSPTSLRVTLRLMRLGLGREWTIAEAFQREHSIAARFMAHPDFVEGVSTLLIRKEGEPKWSPPTLEGVTEEDAAAFVTPTPGEDRLPLLRVGPQAEYAEYPHVGLGIGLPRESEVRAVVRGGKYVVGDVLGMLVEQREGKAGVREKVLDILRRRTEQSPEGFVQWKN